MEIKSIFVALFVLLGIFFMLIGSIGILRLPDFFSRTHAMSKSDTLGILFVVLGLVIHDGTLANSLKLLLIMIFIALSNPVGAHALANAALKKGMKPLLHKKKKED
jgi:multicomponent Na+:H+ antiporter subunit G